LVYPWEDEDDLSSGMVMIQGTGHFGYPIHTIHKDNCAEEVVIQEFRAVIGTIHVGIAHMFKHNQELGMFGNGALREFCQRRWGPVSSPGWWCA